MFSFSFCISFAQEAVSDSTVVEEGLTYIKLISELDNNVHRSDSIDKAMVEHIEKNTGRTITGYRLRIFFDNKQDARAVSEQIAAGFSEQYPDVPVYRVYTNPYFKVTVGNFRSKSDALRFLNRIKEFYPSVFLVKESFSTI